MQKTLSICHSNYYNSLRNCKNDPFRRSFDLIFTLTLVSLSIEKAPHKVATNRAERRLSEPGSHELMAVDLMHLAPHSDTPPIKGLRVLLEHL